MSASSFCNKSFAILLVVLVAFYGCDDEGEKKPEPAVASSYLMVQKKIFNKSCALSGCHSSQNDATYLQHNLVLAEGVSYKNLVNADPENDHAFAEGYKRVAPGDPAKSLILHKLECDLSHHDGLLGNPMPLGKESLSQGQIDFLTAWIEQGAPETGLIDADSTLLGDNVPSCDEVFTPLAPPTEGTGFQIAVSPFEVQPMFEREIFIYKDLGNTNEVYVNRIQMKMRRNSHHFLVNTFSAETPAQLVPSLNTMRDLRDANGKYSLITLAQMEYHHYFIASQTATLDYTFPAGVALKLPAHHRLDVNLHYVNKSQSTTILGECYVNLYTQDPAQVVHEAKTIFWNNREISLPANKTTIITKTFTASEPMTIFMLTSHTHKLAQKFEIMISGGVRDGELIYSNEVWDHPEVKVYGEPIVLAAGHGLTMKVTYNNTLDKSVNFGLTSEDEMGIIYGYYY